MADSSVNPYPSMLQGLLAGGGGGGGGTWTARRAYQREGLMQLPLQDRGSVRANRFRLSANGSPTVL